MVIELVYKTLNWWRKFLFRARKAIYGDKFLSTLAIDEQALLQELEEKSVAIVGNARDLSQTSLGAEIDTYDVIIRLNDAPIPCHGSHGSHTDWMAVAKRVSLKTIMRRRPTTILWMPSKRNRLSVNMATFSRFYLQPVNRNIRLKALLGSPPSIGIMMIDLVGSSNAKEINLFGFDFFTSRSLSGRRSADQVPHNFEAEREMVESILKSDDRFCLWPMKKQS